MDFHALNNGSRSIEDYLQKAKGLSNNLTAINRLVSPANLCHQILLDFSLEYNHLVSTLLTATRIVASFEEWHSTLLKHDTRLRLQTSGTHLIMDRISFTINYAQKGNQQSPPQCSQ